MYQTLPTAQPSHGHLHLMRHDCSAWPDTTTSGGCRDPRPTSAYHVTGTVQPRHHSRRPWFPSAACDCNCPALAPLLAVLRVVPVPRVSNVYPGRWLPESIDPNVVHGTDAHTNSISSCAVPACTAMTLSSSSGSTVHGYIQHMHNLVI